MLVSGEKFKSFTLGILDMTVRRTMVYDPVPENPVKDPVEGTIRFATVDISV